MTNRQNRDIIIFNKEKAVTRSGKSVGLQRVAGERVFKPSDFYIFAKMRRIQGKKRSNASIFDAEVSRFSRKYENCGFENTLWVQGNG